MSVQARIMKAALGASFSKAVLIGGQLLVVPLLVGRWGVALYGAWLALTALSSYLTYSAVGLAQALRSDMALQLETGGEPVLRKTFQTAVAGLLMTTTVALAAYLAAVHLAPVAQLLKITELAPNEVRRIAALMACSIVINLLNGLAAAALAALGRYGLAQSIDASRALAEYLCLGVLVGIFKLGPSQAALIYPATALAALVASLVFLGRTARWLFAPIELDFTVFRRLARPMLGALLLTFGYTGLSVQAPRIIIANTLGPSAVALFAISGMLLRIARIPIEVPAFSATVEISRAYGKGDVEGARRLLASSAQFSLWLAFLILPVVMIGGSFAAHLWTAGRADVPESLIVLLSIATLCYSIGLPAQEGLMALNRLSEATIGLALLAAPFCGLMYLASQHFGLNGAAAAMIALELAFALLTTFVVLRNLDFPIRRFAAVSISPPFALLQQQFRNARAAAVALATGRRASGVPE